MMQNATYTVISASVGMLGVLNSLPHTRTIAINKDIKKEGCVLCYTGYMWCAVFLSRSKLFRRWSCQSLPVKKLLFLLSED